MTPENFCYWLKGYFELQKPTELHREQVDEIQRHLNIVFNNPTMQINQYNNLQPPGLIEYKPIYGSC